MKKYTFEDLVEIIKQLRGENGCPWDKEQTYESLKPCVLEEAYEVIDAADEGGMKLADELGDLLLQVVMLSQIASEEHAFTIDDVIRCVSEKMIRRHPHVFAADHAENAEQVLDKWNEIKKGERGDKTHTDELKSVAKALPALKRAYKIQHKASKIGFDWDDVGEAVKKLHEEADEVADAIAKSNGEKITEEIGDMLFSTVNVARFLEVDPEFALNKTTQKFVRRFEYIETEASKQNKTLETMTLAEMDALWDEAKAKEKH